MSKIRSLPLREARDPLPFAPIERTLAKLRRWLDDFQGINELEQLSDRQLRDIGIERRQMIEIAEREIARLRAR